jgi:hypothetical protein
MLVSRNALVRGFLCNAAGDGAGGGGAGDEKKFLTEEQFGELFNRAFTAKWRDFEKKLGTAQSERDQEFLTRVNTTLDEKLDKLLKNDDGEPDKDGKQQRDDSVKKDLERFAIELDAERSARKAAEAKTAEVEGQRRFDGAREKLKGLLKEKAHPDFLDDWVDRLTVVQKRLSVGEDGSATLRVRHIPYKGATEEETDLPLEQAVAALLQRPEEKKFQGVPATNTDKQTRGPRDARGTGAPNPKSDNPLERVEARLNALGSSLEEEFGGALG